VTREPSGPQDWAAHSPLTDPRDRRALLRTAPRDPRDLAAAVRGLVAHYRGDAGTYPPERTGEIDTRWVADVLGVLAGRGVTDLATALPPAERFVGCCRDFSLLFVAALRERGVPARTRVGFADYFRPDFHVDHVVAEYHDGGRWVRVDPELDPASFPFDVADMDTGPRGPFRTAATVWTQYRAGEIDDDGIRRFGVDPDLPLRGPAFVAGYVLQELAHLHGHELLLWDVWGDMEALDGPVEAGDPAALAEVDRLAALLLDPDAHRAELAAAFDDDRYHPRGTVRCLSPTGAVSRVALAR